jgi:hypothetical protein
MKFKLLFAATLSNRVAGVYAQQDADKSPQEKTVIAEALSNKEIAYIIKKFQ